jgi:P-type Cu+ transporter
MSGRVELVIGGMTCASCAARIERKLNRLDGVAASVNYATEKALVTAPESVTTDVLVSVVEKLGYTAAVPDPEPASEPEFEPESDALRTRLLVSLVLSVPVIAMAMSSWLQFEYWQWASLALAAPVVVWGALPFHRAAWLNLRHGAATMDTLISMGTIAAFVWSLYALFFGSAGSPGMTDPFRLTIERMGGDGNIYLEVAAGHERRALVGGALDLLREAVGRPRRGERAEHRVGRARIARLDVGQRLGELL